ncbi:hypothetical protein GTQ40_04575 [Flavobacteriaceae bacterium R38]|nr:hypothetical protein [Flavobacteriaceae bacterium R38]
MSIKRLFLLCCLAPTLLFFTSCSTDSVDTEIDAIEESPTNLFRAEVDDTTFQADNINVNLEGSLINIVGTETETNRSVFLTFVLKDNVQALGDSERNPNGNIAGYLLNDSNIGYLTNVIDGILGEIKITNLDNENNTISGEFFFTAYNQEFTPVQLKNGVFENVPFER